MNLLQWFGLESLFSHPLTFTLLLVIFIFVMIKIINGGRSEKLNLPPSPSKLPIIGNIHQLGGKLLHRSIHDLSQRCGPLMFLHLGSTPILVVSSPEMIREIRVTHDIPFANRPSTTANKILLYGPSNMGFLPHGDYWKQVRKISNMELLSTKKVQSFKYIRQEEVALMVEKISYASSTGTPVNVTELVVALANDIICRCSLGRKHGGQDGNTNFGELAHKVMKLVAAFSFGDFYPWLAWIDNLSGLMGRIHKVSRELDAFFDQIIDEHLVQNKFDDPDYHQDFVDVLLHVQKGNKSLTRENIKGLIMDNFIGGTDTVSTTIEWAIAELVKNPHVMQKTQEEVRRVVGLKNKIDEEDIHQMNYLKSVVKETLRLHPPVTLNIAESSVTTNVKGYHIPAKTKVLISVWSIQRDPKLWERPEEFIPERFNNNPLDYTGQDYKYNPFGSGRRICPGSLFGIIVVEFAIASLLYGFNWKMLHGDEVDLTESFGVTVNKKVPLHLCPTSHFS